MSWRSPARPPRRGPVRRSEHPGTRQPGQGRPGMNRRGPTAREWFKPRADRVSSRSGGMTRPYSYYLHQAGLGLSTIVHVGGDPSSASPIRDHGAVPGGPGDPDGRDVRRSGRHKKNGWRTWSRAAVSPSRSSPYRRQGGQVRDPFLPRRGDCRRTRGSYETKVKRLREVGVHVVDAIADIPAKARKFWEPRPFPRAPGRRH